MERIKKPDQTPEADVISPDRKNGIENYFLRISVVIFVAVQIIYLFHIFSASEFDGELFKIIFNNLITGGFSK